jgi:D-arabinose 1-dehydrogenase-like Zn-dependent alcohol dehydrogenase
LILLQLGAPKSEIKFSADMLIMFGRQMVGSMTGGPRDYEDMLAFSAKHGIEAKVEIFALNQVNDALSKVAKNQVKYRAVIEM